MYTAPLSPSTRVQSLEAGKLNGHVALFLEKTVHDASQWTIASGNNNNIVAEDLPKWTVQTIRESQFNATKGHGTRVVQPEFSEFETARNELLHAEIDNIYG